MWHVDVILVVRWLMGNDEKPIIPPPGSEWRIRATELHRTLELPVPPQIGLKLIVPTNPEFQKADDNPVESGVLVLQITDLTVDLLSGGVTAVAVLQNNDPALSRQTARRITEWLVSTSGFEENKGTLRVVPRLSHWTAPLHPIGPWGPPPPLPSPQRDPDSDIDAGTGS